MLDGIQLDASDAVERLERMLWGLEALRVFDDRLSTSLSQIRKTRENLEHTIDQVQSWSQVFWKVLLLTPFVGRCATGYRTRTGIQKHLRRIWQAIQYTARCANKDPVKD